MNEMTASQKEEMQWLEANLFGAFGRYTLLGQQLADGKLDNAHIQECIKAFDDLCLVRSALSHFLNDLTKENPR